MVSCPNINSKLYKDIEAAYGKKAASNFYVYMSTPEFIQWKGDDEEPTFTTASNGELYVQSNKGEYMPITKGIYFMAKVAGYNAGFVGEDGRYRTYLPSYYNKLRSRVITFNTQQPHYLATITKGLSSEPGDRREYFSVTVSYKKPKNNWERRSGKDIILPIGTSGSGKSTWIKSLPKNTYFVISPDEMRVEFTGNMNDKSKDEEIYEELNRRVINAIFTGQKVIIDSTNLQRDRRRNMINVIKGAIPDANIMYKLMPLNPELAKQRIKNDITSGVNRANVPDSTIDRHAELYKQMLKDITEEDIEEYDNTKDQRVPAIEDQASLALLTNIVEKMQNKFGIQGKIVNNPGIVKKGWFENGIAYVNAAYATADTPFHEFTHPLIETIRVVNKPLYQSLIADIEREGSVLEKTKRLYPELQGDDLYEEAIVQAIGQYAADELKDVNLIRKIKLVLQTIMKYLQDLFPHSVYLPHELPSVLTLEDMGILLASDIRLELGEITAKSYEQRFSKVEQEYVLNQVASDEQQNTVEAWFNMQEMLSKSGEDHYVDNENNIYERVSNVKGSTFEGDSTLYQIDREVGNQVDNLLTALIRGVDDVNLPVTSNLMPNVREHLIKHFKAVIKELTKDGTVLISQASLFAKVPGWKTNVAGTEDIIAIHPDGSNSFYDLKTSNASTKDVYYTSPRTGNGITRSKRQDHQLQLSYYQKLAETMGFSVRGLYIIPVHIPKSGRVNNIVRYAKEEPIVTLKYAPDEVEASYEMYERHGKPTDFDPERIVYEDPDITKLYARTATQEQTEVFKLVKTTLQNRIDLLKQQQVLGNVQQESRLKKLEYLKSLLVADNVLEEVSSIVNSVHEDLVTGIKNDKGEITSTSLQDKFRQLVKSSVGVIKQSIEANDLAPLSQLLYRFDLYKKYAIDYSNLAQIKGIYQDALQEGVLPEANSVLEKIRDILEVVGDIEHRYIDAIKPITHAIVSSELPSNVAGAATELLVRIDRMKATRKERESLGKDTSAVESNIKELETEFQRLYPAKANLLKQLSSTAKDISMMEYWTGTGVNSSDQVISLFLKRLKGYFFRVDEVMIREQQEHAQAFNAFKEATGRNRDKPSEFYQDIYERRKMYRYNRETEEIDSWEEMAFVDKTNKSKYSLEEAKMFKYAESLQGDDRSNYIFKWYKSNTIPIDNLNEVIAAKKEDVDNKVITLSEYNEWWNSNVRVDNLTNSIVYIKELSQPNNQSLDKFLNPNWQVLESPANKAVKEYHAFLLKKYLDAQKKLPMSTRLGTRLPSIHKSFEDKMREKGGIKAMWEDLKDSFVPSEARDVLRYGTNNKVIPVYYVQSMKPDDISLDLAGNVLRFQLSAEDYEARTLAEPEANAMVAVLKARTIESTTPLGETIWMKAASKLGFKTPLQDATKDNGGNAAKFLEHFVNQNIYGQGEEKTLLKIGNTVIDVGKTVNTFMAFTSALQLGGPFNALKATANKLTAETNLFIESYAKRYLDNISYLKGKADYDSWAFGGDFLRDTNSPYPKSLNGQLMAYFSPIQGDFRDSLGHDMSQSFTKKALRPSTWYFMFGAGEHSAQMSMFFGMMHATKVKQGDKEISLKDAYELGSDGKFKLKDGVEFTIKQKDEFINRIHAINKQLHGVYNKQDKSVLQRGALGRLVMMYRKYLAPSVRRRWGDTRIDMELNDVTEGFYRTLWKAITNDYKELGKYIIGKNNQFSAFEIANLRRAMAEISVMITLSILLYAMLGFRDHDKDLKQGNGVAGYAFNAMLYEVMRLSSEFQFYLPPFGIDDNLRVFTSPSAAFNHLGNLLKFFKQLFLEPLEQYGANAGRWHDKGDYKLPAAALKVLGANSADPTKAMQQFNQYLQ